MEELTASDSDIFIAHREFLWSLQAQDPNIAEITYHFSDLHQKTTVRVFHQRDSFPVFEIKIWGNFPKDLLVGIQKGRLTKNILDAAHTNWYSAKAMLGLYPEQKREA